LHKLKDHARHQNCHRKLSSAQDYKKLVTTYVTKPKYSQYSSPMIKLLLFESYKTKGSIKSCP